MRRTVVAWMSLASALSACGQEPADERSPQTVIVEAPANETAPAAPAAEVATAPEPNDALPALPADPSDAAAQAERSPMLAACLNTGDAAKGVTPAMAGCFNEELQRQDRQLNAAYRGAMNALGTTGKTWLRGEERKWIAARDAECEGRQSGGTIDRIEIPACLVDETIKRRLVLQELAGGTVG